MVLEEQKLIIQLSEPNKLDWESLKWIDKKWMIKAMKMRAMEDFLASLSLIKKHDR